MNNISPKCGPFFGGVCAGAFVAFSLSWLVGCSAASGPARAGEPVAEAREQLTAASATPAPATPAQKEITIASRPNAKCIVQSSTATNSSQSMPVWADDVGLVHLWAAQKSSSDAYSLDCSGSGDTAKHVFDLAHEATFVPAAAAFAPVGRTTRPALTDPSSLSNADLIKGGYPPRPDPSRAPKSYQKWLDAVSKPATVIPANLVERSDVRFGTSQVWCGPVMAQPSTRYIVSADLFHIPTFFPVGGSSAAAIWSGLDGWNDSDVIQDGVLYQASGSVGSYSSWRQYFPNGPVFISSMVVSPTDQMYMWSWEGDASCTYGAGHTGHGCFIWEDFATGITTPTFNVTAPNNFFTGAFAEGTMERVNGIWLAEFLPAPMEFDAWDSTLTEHDVSSDFGFDSTLVNGAGTTMCTDTDSNPDNTTFNFVNPN